MTATSTPQGLMNIGEEAKPPFAVLADPNTLFSRRAERLRALAPNHPLEAYLRFVADWAEAQNDILAALPPVAAPEEQVLRQASDHGIPPLARVSHAPGEAMDATLSHFLARIRKAALPEAAAKSVDVLDAMTAEARRQAITGALKDVPAEDIAERVLVLASLQVHFARLASKLDADTLKPIADGVCPTCGSPPMTTSVVGWPKAHNTRFCACSLCATQWNAVRIKCVLCSSTEGIAYQTLEGAPETIKAECCDKCGHYVKILYQVKDHLLDPFADDIATLGLDVKVVAEDWKRGGANPFLMGY